MSYPAENVAEGFLGSILQRHASGMDGKQLRKPTADDNMPERDRKFCFRTLNVLEEDSRGVHRDVGHLLEPTLDSGHPQTDGTSEITPCDRFGIEWLTTCFNAIARTISMIGVRSFLLQSLRKTPREDNRF